MEVGSSLYDGVCDCSIIPTSTNFNDFIDTPSLPINMFWRFGGYANISTLNNILEKPDVTLEEVLDESDLIQELKQSNSKLIEFLRDENVLRRLLELVVAPQTPRPEDDGQGEESEEENRREKPLSPFRRRQKEKSKRQEEFEDWEKADKARTQKAYTASEILSSETWSILESLMANQQLLRTFWDFLKRESPLDSQEAGNFTKINETLLDKKTEAMMRFLHSYQDVIPIMLKHIDCAAIMDLLLKIISMEKSEGGAGVVDVWQTFRLEKQLYVLRLTHTYSGYRVKTSCLVCSLSLKRITPPQLRLLRATSSKLLSPYLQTPPRTNNHVLAPTILPGNWYRSHALRTCLRTC